MGMMVDSEEFPPSDPEIDRMLAELERRFARRRRWPGRWLYRVKVWFEEEWRW